MPKIEADDDPKYILTKKLVSEFMKTWHEQNKESGVDEVLFSQLSVVALSQVAAIIGVDIGMRAEQFSNVCQANFKQAYDIAPKFS